MSLQQLVDYFNNRLEQEIETGFRPLFIQKGVVHGVFGPICIESILEPLRKTLRSTQVIGYIAKQSISAYRLQALQRTRT